MNLSKKRLQGDLLYLAEHDSLTHVANRLVKLAEQLKEAVKMAESGKLSGCAFLY